MSEHKEYLGDGAYVDITDYGDVTLTTENGREVTNTIVLEPRVLAQFEDYIKRQRKMNNG